MTIQAGTFHTNANRNGGVLHRNSVTTVDKLAQVGTITLSGTDTVNGVLVSATTYYVSASAYNRWGSGTPATVVSGTPGGSNKTMRAAFAQITGADGYDIFLSVDSGAPKWVGRITETQRASGILLTAVGTTGAGGSAGSVDVRVVGTGLQSTVAPFAASNAYTPASPTPINCVGYARAHVLVALAVTDLRSLPTLAITPFFANQVSGSDWHQGAWQSVALLTTFGQGLEQEYVVDVDGATGLVVLVDTISGQGAAVSIWVELA